MSTRSLTNMANKQTNKRAQKARDAGRLTDYQLATLTDILVDDDKDRAEALLILVDEIGYRQGDREDEGLALVKRRAFEKCGSDSIQAHINLIRAEYPG